VTFQGKPAALLEEGAASLTGAYLRGERTIATPARGAARPRELVIAGAAANNLKNIDVSIPMGSLTR
jgi:excinuclease ABC subunit A